MQSTSTQAITNTNTNQCTAVHSIMSFKSTTVLLIVIGTSASYVAICSYDTAYSTLVIRYTIGSPASINHYQHIIIVVTLLLLLTISISISTMYYYYYGTTMIMIVVIHSNCRRYMILLGSA